ncbi:G-type lectin S-receptor-like serine/threonine-protein kinase At2g19130 [Macadamia integrifolia]|uniref:G-type lectin S-receptor-like serine/threonine-protein kinase At2g19130 n=1 Tax=Macadamia integrifolia TaxID=60698 RepID=UPI001C52B7AB|nr:G-type lectin S-receptor-like serine/threonine-protein kinase At2g19130 [Macadamia integrifolia]
MMMGVRNRAWVFDCVMFLCFSLNTHLCFGAGAGAGAGAGILSVGESISGDHTIISIGDGNFELGFFTPGKTQNYYVGIWYRKISEKTVVWVANRDKPLSDKYSSQLKLLDDGNLVILDPSKTLIWSTNLTSKTPKSTEAALLDSGNFVLRNVSNSSAFVWESFDHPANTWLPGGKLGLNKRTNKSQLLTSWKNSEDPALGIFALELDPAGTSQYFILWNVSVKYWTSGTWDGHIFSLVPEMRSNYIYDFTYVSNKDESYFTYSLKNSSIISRFVMDVSGQIKQLSWLDGVGWNLFWAQPRQQCEVYALCGAFGTCNQQAAFACGCLQGFSPRYPTDYTNLSDWSGGCVRNTQLQCVNNASVNGEKDGFLLITNITLPINPKSLAVESAQACALACLNNCSCNAYAYNDNCSVWEGDLLNMQQLSDGTTVGGNLYLKLAASELLKSTSGGNKKGSATGAIVGAVSGAVALLGLVAVLIWLRQRRTFVGRSKPVEGSLVPFSYRELQSATKNFSEKLGGGGFGSVFKGTLPDSTVVAVKKLEGISQGEKQFRTEVSTIGTIQHVNLVRLHGFCSEGTKRLLVYDFMPKGSLDSHLFHVTRESEVLDWKLRYEIAIGTARGLTYLHEKCRDCIIHCDIKPENILLDAEFCPKVADFGLAKLVGREFSRVLTTMRGTRGYLAPEWISGVAITTKADVYSYGMMLFELISGRRNSDQPDGERVGFFPSWAATKINEDGEILSLLDHRLEGNADLAELTRACKVACWCVQDAEGHRPSMGLVVQILEGVMDVSPPPIPRTLQSLAENHEHIVFFAEPSSNQSSQTRSPSSGTPSQAKSTTSSTSSMA